MSKRLKTGAAAAAKADTCCRNCRKSEALEASSRGQRVRKTPCRESTRAQTSLTSGYENTQGSPRAGPTFGNPPPPPKDTNVR